MTDVRVDGRGDAALRLARERAEVLWRAPIGVIELTLGGVIVAANEAFAEMLGYRPGDLIGRLEVDLVDAAHSAVIGARGQGAAVGQGRTAERCYLSSDGRSVPVHVSSAVLHDRNGAVSRFEWFIVDMSEFHAQRVALSTALVDVAAERDELARRQSFTDALLETVDVAIVSCDADGGSPVCNRAGRALLGVPERAPAGAPEDTVVPTGIAGPIDLLDSAGELVDPAHYPLARALRGGPVGDLDFRVGPVGGPYRDVVIRGGRITLPDGTLAGAVVAFTDVSAERIAARELAAERERLTEAQRLGQLGSFSYDPVSGQFTFSEQIYRIWGLPLGADLPGLRAKMIHPDDLHRVVQGWDAVLVVGGAYTSEYRIVRPDKSIRHLRTSIEVVLSPSGDAVSMHGTHLDVTDLTLAQREAVEANTLLQAILTATPDYTYVTDTRAGTVVYGSPGKTLLGITTGQLEQLGPSILATLLHPEEQPRLRAANLAARGLADGEVLQTRYQARHTDASWHWLSRRVTPFRRDESTGEVLEVLGVVTDVTDVVDAEERLTHTALHDPLTGLPNRALLMDRLDAALARAHRTRRGVAILFCDLDGFKRVNDTAGHAAGDAVLVETATRLTAALREHDTVARIGGDEFVVVVEPWKRSDRLGASEATAADAQVQALDDRRLAVRLAERITKAVRVPITVDGVEHRVTVSIGITYAGPSATAADSPATADAVLKDADAAMYHAKNAGKDRFEIFEHGMTDLADRGGCGVTLET